MDGFAESLMWINKAGAVEVPFFQRPYVWEDENFDSLIESFLDAPGNTMPFFGSVILKELDDSEPKKYLVIDGQQRITTFSILIRALLDIRNKHNLPLAGVIDNAVKYFIYDIKVDSDGNEVYRVKLIPSNADKTSYLSIMDASDDRSGIYGKLDDSPIHKAYKYFFDYFDKAEKLEEAKLFFLKLYDQCKSLIFIILNRSDDEQKIFDSVNSLGRPLSNSDIIKNYLYQRMKELSYGDQVKIDGVMANYYKTWDEVFYANNKKEFWYKEVVLGRVKMDYLESFLKDFAIVKGFYFAKNTTGAYGLCKAYKDYIDKLCDKNNPLDEIKAFSEELKEYAETFYEFRTEYLNIDKFIWGDAKNRVLLILDYLDTSTFNPYILKLFKSNPPDINDKIKNFERFFLKRFIYEGTTKNYNQCCEGLLKAKDDAVFYKEYMKESPVCNSTYTTKFRKLTNKQGTLFLFLLEMLARKGNESKYSDQLKISSYSLEHVMPQKWHSSWMKVDSYDEAGNKIDRNDTKLFEDNRNAAVKSLGNFALLTGSLNGSLSNEEFGVKIEGKTNKNGKTYDGMRKYASALCYTKAIIEHYDNGNVWDENTIFANEKAYFTALNNEYNF